MAKLNKEAFAIMAMCEEAKKPFGITVNPHNGCYAFTWAFKINPDQAKREGYDKTYVRGAVMYDPEFNGCPYCGSKQFYICNHCKKVVCFHGQEYVICPNCSNSSSLRPTEAVDLEGGGF